MASNTNRSNRQAISREHRIEEGAKRLSPSSFEISFPKAQQHRQSSRMPTLNVTLNNIERHAKTRKTEPETPTQQESALRTQTGNQNFYAEKFFSTQRTGPQST